MNKNYKITVTISDPNTQEGMNSDIYYSLTATFLLDTFGNGCYLQVKDGSGRFENSYDLRYDTDFNADHMVSYLATWADNYWSGRNGAYKLNRISIKEL